MNKVNKNSGLTLLEVLVVLGIVVVLLGISIGVYFSLRQTNQLEIETEKVVSAVRLVQNRTLAAENFVSHGVHFDTTNDTYTLFQGTVFDPMDANNELNTLDERVEFLNIQLEGGGFDVIFDRLLASTSQSGFVEIIDKQDTTQIKIICIENSGNIRVLDIGETSSSCVDGALEYVSGTTDADLASFPGNSGNGDPAQSFTVGATTLSASRVDLYIRRNGTPSDVYLEIREGSTVGIVIGKSWLAQGSSLPTSLSWVQFIFPSPVQLSATTQYFLRLRSLPESTILGSTAAGTIYWGYEYPGTYGGGDAWRYVGANDITTDDGMQLGPADPYDFSFKIFSEDGPVSTDSRHLEFDFSDDLRDYTNLELSFNGGTVTQTVPIALPNLNSASTIFDWEDTIDVGGSNQTIRIHSLYIDGNSTVLSVHRDGELNNVSLDIDIDVPTTIDLVDYTAGGTPTKGETLGFEIDSMVYR